MTSGRTSIAAGAVAAAGATVAMFAGANMIGHTLGYDLWPMFDGDGARVIEVPAASPNGPGVNPLLPTSSPLTRAAAGDSTAPGPAVFGPAALPRPVLGVGPAGRTSLPGASVRRSGSTAQSQRKSARRRAGRGSNGATPRQPASSAPAASAPTFPASSGGSLPTGSRPSTESGESGSKSAALPTGNTTVNRSRKANRNNASPNGAAKSSGDAAASQASTAAPAAVVTSGGSNTAGASGTDGEDSTAQSASGASDASSGSAQGNGGD